MFKERRAEREKNRALKLLEDGKYDRAVTLLRKSAEGGCTIAQYNLGVCYYQGVGVTVDIDETIKWWRMAAESGCVEAQNNMGAFYYQGLGVEQSYEEAVRWYTMAAEQGDARAQYNLAECYYYGLGVDENFDMGVELDAKAADQGLADAQCRLGELCIDVSLFFEPDKNDLALGILIVHNSPFCKPDRPRSSHRIGPAGIL